jgi:hypothetical protein
MAVTVYDATWELVAWNRLGAALLGDLEALDGRERNLVWREFRGTPPSRFARDGEETGRFRQELVSDLHAALGAFPEDERLAALIADLRAGSEDSSATGRAGRSPSAWPRARRSRIPRSVRSRSTATSSRSASRTCG